MDPEPNSEEASKNPLCVNGRPGPDQPVAGELTPGQVDRHDDMESVRVREAELDQAANVGRTEEHLSRRNDGQSVEQCA
jgi:hypothetical protein